MENNGNETNQTSSHLRVGFKAWNNFEYPLKELPITVNNLMSETPKHSLSKLYLFYCAAVDGGCGSGCRCSCVLSSSSL